MVSRVAAKLRWQDQLSALKVRCRIGRMNYGVEPGLYAVGDPSPESPVLVSANYKLSFDRLRQELGGLDLWLVVLDTKKVNVWCSAAKGTFSTDELVKRIELSGLAKIVNHRTLILPQLAAPGVAAHEVRERTGFAVKYGPIRAKDIPAYLKAGLKATQAMRRIRFNVLDRIVVIPVELSHWSGYALALAAVLFTVSLLLAGESGSALARQTAMRSGILVLAAYLAGAVVSPILLPWLPGRAFSIKGAIVGLALAAICLAAGWVPLNGAAARAEATSWIFLAPAISAFAAINYTGTSTYTSQSGVQREMRIALPVQIAGAVVGLGFWVASQIMI
jgi:acetyl-CoA decarbonylase/synthase complex subunit gamma